LLLLTPITIDEPNDAQTEAHPPGNAVLSAETWAVPPVSSFHGASDHSNTVSGPERRFLQKTHMPGTQIIKTTGNNNFRHRASPSL
jgi:hypothetical protein